MNLNEYTGKPKTASNLAWHRPQATKSREEDELMEKSSRAVSHTTDPLEKLRLLCFCHGAAGIMSLCRIFRRLDKDGCSRLTKDEFFEGIKESGLEFSHDEAEELFSRFEVDQNDSISLDEFIDHIRPPMVESRRKIVEQAFKKIDKSGAGKITVDELKRVFDVTCNPRYMSGEETADWCMNNFLENFDSEGTVGGTVTTVVTLEEFMNYYSGISVSIDNDCFFDLMMRKSYKL